MKYVLIILFICFSSIANAFDKSVLSDANAVVYISGTITPVTYDNTINQITTLDKENPNIIIVLNSYGGNVFTSIGIATYLVTYAKQYNKTIITYAHGNCASMCTYLFNFGDIRVAEKSTIFQYHGASYGNQWSFHGTDIQINKLKSMNVNQEFVDKMINDGTFMKINKNATNYTVQELQDANIITEIVK